MVKEGNGYLKAFKVVQNTIWRTHRSWTSPVGSRNFCSCQGHVELLQEGFWGLWHQKGFQANQARNHLPVCRELFSMPRAAHGPFQHPSSVGACWLQTWITPSLYLLHSRVLAAPSMHPPNMHPSRHKSLTPSVPCVNTCHCFTDSRLWRGGSQLIPVTETSLLLYHL